VKVHAVFGAVSMKIKVLYLASLREQLGKGRRRSRNPARDLHGRGLARAADGSRRGLAGGACTRAVPARRRQPGNGAAGDAGETGDEIAFLPSGDGRLRCRCVSRRRTSTRAPRSRRSGAATPKIGAVASFIGVCRDANDGHRGDEDDSRTLSRHDREGARKNRRRGEGRWNVMKCSWFTASAS